jgi:hypothetical protein
MGYPSGWVTSANLICTRRLFKDGFYHFVAHLDRVREPGSKVLLDLLEPVTIRFEVAEGDAVRPCLSEKSMSQQRSISVAE